mgnify:CR=1 FL=1
MTRPEHPAPARHAGEAADQTPVPVELRRGPGEDGAPTVEDIHAIGDGQHSSDVLFDPQLSVRYEGSAQLVRQGFMQQGAWL